MTPFWSHDACMADGPVVFVETCINKSEFVFAQYFVMSLHAVVKRGNNFYLLTEAGPLFCFALDNVRHHIFYTS